MGFFPECYVEAPYGGVGPKKLLLCKSTTIQFESSEFFRFEIVCADKQLTWKLFRVADIRVHGPKIRVPFACSPISFPVSGRVILVPRNVPLDNGNAVSGNKIACTLIRRHYLRLLVTTKLRRKLGQSQTSPQAFSARSILDSTVSCDVTDRDFPRLRADNGARENA